MMEAILREGLSALSLPGSGVPALLRYAELLAEKNKVMNLTAITDPAEVARLHFLDSAALLTLADFRGKAVVDVGTGAGFPGLVLKILEPSLALTLVDSLGKRVNWLSEVCEALSLDGVRCLHARAEELALAPEFRDGFDLAVSRAVAAFPLLCELCLPYVKVGGAFIAMKSVDSAAEVQAGEKAVKTLGGRLSAPVDYPVPGAGVTHRLVVVDKVFPTPRGYPRSWGKIKKAPL